MTTLAESISNPDRRKAVIDDCVLLLKAEVADKRGVRGMAVKAGFKTVENFKPGIIPMSLNALLEDFATKVDPFWSQSPKDSAGARRFFGQRKVQVANALLEITDARADRSKHRVLVRAYRGLRGKAVDHIGAAMPRFADLLVKHAS